MTGFLRDLSLRRAVAWGSRVHVFSLVGFGVILAAVITLNVIVGLVLGETPLLIGVLIAGFVSQLVVGAVGAAARSSSLGRSAGRRVGTVAAVGLAAVALALVATSFNPYVRILALGLIFAVGRLLARAADGRVTPRASAASGHAPPTRLGIDPIIATKAALIRATRDGTAQFLPLTHRSPYDAEATAVCDVPHGFGEHPYGEKVPAAECSCGFYALTELPAYMHASPHIAILQVDLSGRVIRHRKGWRAERQRVLDVTFRRRCRFCRYPADGLAAVDDETPSAVLNAGQIFVPMCAPHAERRRVALLAPVDVGAKLGTTVRWADPAAS